MTEWVDSHSICYAEGATKIEFFEIIKLNKPRFQTFTNDSILTQHVHVLLRLSLYHLL
jgi:hypothetical protein